MISQYKDPYSPISIVESHRGFDGFLILLRCFCNVCFCQMLIDFESFKRHNFWVGSLFWCSKRGLSKSTSTKKPSEIGLPVTLFQGNQLNDMKITMTPLSTWILCCSMDSQKFQPPNKMLPESLTIMTWSGVPSSFHSWRPGWKTLKWLGWPLGKALRFHVIWDDLDDGLGVSVSHYITVINSEISVCLFIGSSCFETSQLCHRPRFSSETWFSPKR